MTIIFLITGLIIYLLKSLDFIYLFQTKEYRLDRIISLFKEENIFRLIYLRNFRMPAVTLRNLIISQVIFIASLIFTFLLIKQDLTVLLAFLILSPVLALLTMLVAVVLSEIPVQHYRKNLIRKAGDKIKNSQAVFIGITGSSGKTSTKEFLYQILSRKFKVAKTVSNYNSEVGVAISVLRYLKPDTEFFIAELGAYRKGEIHAACQLIKPKYGILTNLGNQHLALFGSKENLVKAKSELLESLPKNGIAYINKDIQEWEMLAKKTRAKIHYFSAKNNASGIKTNLLGEHNSQNIIPCIEIALDLGLDKKVINQTVKNLKPVIGRLNKVPGLNGSTILDDSYNSNVDGFISALKTAELLHFRKKLIISRGLIELGPEKESSYQKILDNLDNSNLTLLTTDKLFSELLPDKKVVYFTNEKMLLEYLGDKIDNQTLLVIEGRFEPNTLKVLLAN